MYSRRESCCQKSIIARVISYSKRRLQDFSGRSNLVFDSSANISREETTLSVCKITRRCVYKLRLLFRNLAAKLIAKDRAQCHLRQVKTNKVPGRFPKSRDSLSDQIRSYEIRLSFISTEHDATFCACPVATFACEVKIHFINSDLLCVTTTATTACMDPPKLENLMKTVRKKHQQMRQKRKKLYTKTLCEYRRYKIIPSP